MLDGVIGAQRNPRPVMLAGRPGGLEKLAASSDRAIAGKAAKLEELLTWPRDDRKVAVERRAELTEEERRRIESGRALYMGICMPCHQQHGEGMAGMAPSLVGTEWVTGKAERLIRITLQGVAGPIEVHGEEWNLMMPGLGAALDDEQIAAVLSYIRQAWGNAAGSIDAEAVREVRRATAERALPWTSGELRGID